MGLSAHGGRILSRVEPRPIRHGEGTNVFQDPHNCLFSSFGIWSDGLSESFTWAYLLCRADSVRCSCENAQARTQLDHWPGRPFIFVSPCVLVIILNVTADRSTSELNKVFFTASHAIFAMMIGYGVTILAAYVATHYEKIRGWCFVGGGLRAVGWRFIASLNAIGKLLFRPGWPAASVLAALSLDWGGWGFLAFGPNGQFGLSEIPHWIAPGVCQRPIRPADLRQPHPGGAADHFSHRAAGLSHSAARCSFCWHCSASRRFVPACPTGINANSATTGLATGSAMTCSPRPSWTGWQIELR